MRTERAIGRELKVARRCGVARGHCHGKAFPADKGVPVATLRAYGTTWGAETRRELKRRQTKKARAWNKRQVRDA